jgi:formate--tetrahydrofolate ligase
MEASMTGSLHTNPRSDIEIARAKTLRPIHEVAAEAGIDEDSLIPYGRWKAKVELDFIKSLAGKPQGKLILVAGITPTKAGEGKTTTTIGLGDALRRRGKRAMLCLREPSLGPCFGMKGGATGGGHAQLVPMEDINLHFTGDMHAIGAAHNLLSALIDNHLYWDNALRLDRRRVVWPRVLDMNDRALRQITNGLGGVSNGAPRIDRFDITVASEVMAIFCLSRNLEELERRLSNIIVGYRRDLSAVRASDLQAQGAMAVLLRDALQPNLVQTLEHTPAFVHGGPFANIAHGCNSVLATKTALHLADYVVTEAGFGADLGAEKFFDIKCRKSGLKPSCAVIVATVRALKMHGGAGINELGQENLDALSKGMANLMRHVENTRLFGVPVLVALNRFSTDTNAELDLVRQSCSEIGVTVSICDHWATGGEGALELADNVIETLEHDGADFRYLYEDEVTLWNKVRTVAQTIYHAQGIVADQKVREQFDKFQSDGYGHFPVCIAKTPLSFSADPDVKGVPANHIVPVREIRLAGGAEFLVVICGDILTMPGLPRVPAATRIRLDGHGMIEGLR